MFVKRTDIVKYSNSNYIVLIVEDETLVIMNPHSLKYKEVPRSECSKVNELELLTQAALIDLHTGVIFKETKQFNVFDFVSDLPWIDNASLMLRRNKMILAVLGDIVKSNLISKANTDEIFRQVQNLKNGETTTLTIHAVLNNCEIVIKMNLEKIDNKVSVTHAKRVFGDNGIFGEIERKVGTKTIPNNLSNTKSNTKRLSA